MYKIRPKSWFCVLPLLATPLFASDYTTWGRYRQATVNTTGILSAGVSKIPVPIRLTAAAQPDLFTGAAAALANGADLRVTKAGGTDDIPFEIESWTTGSSGSGVVWVLLDTIPANGQYPLRLYWHMPGATSASSGSAVFSSSNGYLAAWHFNEPAGDTLRDAGGVHHATPGAANAAPTHAVEAAIGAGKSFNGSQYYQVGANASVLNLNTSTGPFTITAWANVQNCATRIAVFSKYANNNGATGVRQYVLQTAITPQNWRFSNDPTALSSSSVNNEYVADDVGSCASGAWTWLAATYSTGGVAPTPDTLGASKLILRVNTRNAVTGVPVSNTGSSIGTNSLVFIGKIASNDRYMNGSLDEITVSNVLRSEAWLRLSYETQKPASTIVQVSAESVIQHLVALRAGSELPAGFGIRASGAIVSFRFPAGHEGLTVSVRDLAGRTVWHHRVPAGTREATWRHGAGRVTGPHVARIVFGEDRPAAESRIMLP